MSINNGYLPKADKEKAIWLKNFSGKLQIHAANVGIASEEVIGVSNDALAFLYALEMVENSKNETAQKVSFKNILADGSEALALTYPTSIPALNQPALVKAGIFKRTGKLVQRIKNHPNYNDSIGKDLGVIGSESTQDRTTMKPEISGALDAHRPLIKWKKGTADSIDIYVDRKDGKGFVFLANDSTPDYIDTHPLSSGSDTAIWSYKGIYKIQDEQVGEFSNIINITVTRQIEV
ncbi:hypothetical protein Galf_1817 [Sporocytophaga myxococcoides]|uniref:Uncharacterized protein n=1 Tax=Sporocytophaga myxococcoides TaxID=153721 RepID=A0A098L9Y7_9BACT|nr:hypothetical protein [Sporocytophaga myxococcoides]GAL83113.1 hypothetical protein Galf_1817 [Sporocytophaga myxococcoides]